MNVKRRNSNAGAAPPSFRPRIRSIRPLRLLAAAGILFLLIATYKLSRHSSSPNDKYSSGLRRDPLLDPTLEPPEPLRRVVGKNYNADNPNSDRINATIISLVRNSELDDILTSMADLERTWNSKFNYPWTFFNDEPFTEEFKRRTSELTNAKVRYELVPREHWDVPSWINDDLVQESQRMLKEANVAYADKKSYHQMCRWNSGMFYRHPALADMQYYWRVEPHVEFFCDVDYDVFRYMHEHNKTYGFTINLYDSPLSVATLWPETLKFLADNKKYLHKNNAMDWLTDPDDRRKDHSEIAHGYSTCHFWSNFEIANLDFWRSPAYEAYFEHLDRAGGFFYERWGDAPVHSIALGLFEDKSKIHWFKDIGYHHVPFFNCPNSPKCRKCQAGKFFEGEDFLNLEDCRANWFKYAGEEWTSATGEVGVSGGALGS